MVLVPNKVPWTNRAWDTPRPLIIFVMSTATGKTKTTTLTHTQRFSCEISWAIRTCVRETWRYTVRSICVADSRYRLRGEIFAVQQVRECIICANATIERFVAPQWAAHVMNRRRIRASVTDLKNSNWVIVAYWTVWSFKLNVKIIYPHYWSGRSMKAFIIHSFPTLPV